MSETSFILTLTSDPLPGIIASVATAIADLGGNITETHQHWDRPTNRFFLRVAFVGPEGLTVPAVERALAPTAQKLGLDLRVVDAARPPRIIAMVSKFDHALLHLLYQIRVGWLFAEVVAIVSNHEDARRIGLKSAMSRASLRTIISCSVFWAAGSMATRKPCAPAKAAASMIFCNCPRPFIR